MTLLRGWKNWNKNWPARSEESMNLRQRLKRLDERVADRSEPKATRQVLESMMRYFIVHRHLIAVVQLGHKSREEMTLEEWADFRRVSVEYFNGNRRRYSETAILGYIGAEPETLSAYIASFMALPDRVDYER